MRRHPYSKLDFQLLFELRLGVIEGEALPVSTLRILRTRGWVELPSADEWLFIEADEEEDEDGIDTLSSVNFALTQIRLTPLGAREVALFAQRVSDTEMYGILVDEESGRVDALEEPCDDEPDVTPH